MRSGVVCRQLELWKLDRPGSCAQIVTPGVVCPNADATKSQITYSNGGLSVTATGFLNPVPPSTTNAGRENLYVKNGGPGETSLGTVIDVADHVITGMDFVNLDLSNLWAHGISSAQLTIESLQTGEEYKLCQGNVLGAMGGSCTFGTQTLNTDDTTVSISWGASNNMFGIQGFDAPASGADVLVQRITFDTPPSVPEPASLLLFGSGIAALAVRKRLRGNKQTEAA